MALAGVAQAQTLDSTILGFDKNNNQIFSVDLLAQAATTPTPYTYTYMATLKSISTTAPVNVNTFSFHFDPNVPVVYVSSTPTYAEASLAPGAFSFGTTTGLTRVGDKATFVFTSPFPPSGSVGVSANSDIGGGGVGSLGPGPAAVPEAGTFALLGLGLLPLALVARRRMARSN